MKMKTKTEIPQWEMGPVLGRGSSGVVSVAFSSGVEDFPNTLAVKTSPNFNSSSVRREKTILQRLEGCPQIIRCFGDDTTCDKVTGKEYYHIFLELALCGTLSDAISSRGRLEEVDIRRYTKSVLLGLSHIHREGYVHCDVKPANILLWGSGEVKIADFGLAKRSQEKSEGVLIRGTPLYVAPESIRRNVYEAPADIWALGCTVVEMATGKPAWSFPAWAEVPAVLFKIGRCNPGPEIPENLSEMGKDFVRRCFVKDPANRDTAETLLRHPFMSDGGDDAECFFSQCAAKGLKGDGEFLHLAVGQQHLVL